MTTTAENTLSLTRRFKASRERVFAAFTTLDALQKWMGGGPCHVLGGTQDFRAGGQYFLRMHSHGGEAELRGTYREITPPSRLVYTWQWEGEDEPETLVTIDFIAIGEETELRLTHTGFATTESRDNHNNGWLGSMDKLETAILLQ